MFIRPFDLVCFPYPCLRCGFPSLNMSSSIPSRSSFLKVKALYSARRKCRRQPALRGARLQLAEQVDDGGIAVEARVLWRPRLCRAAALFRNLACIACIFSIHVITCAHTCIICKKIWFRCTTCKPKVITDYIFLHVDGVKKHTI